jgi:hemerythrin-like domain-containing protein
MRLEEGYRDYIDQLVDEHRQLRDLLATADLTSVDDQRRVLAALEELHEHIAKEEDGLFPASLTALDGDQWERAIRVWQTVHSSIAASRLRLP